MRIFEKKEYISAHTCKYVFIKKKSTFSISYIRVLKITTLIFMIIENLVVFSYNIFSNDQTFSKHRFKNVYKLKNIMIYKKITIYNCNSIQYQF